MVLRDKYGFGGKRLEEFLDAVIELLDSVDKGYLNLNDIADTILEETGIKIIIDWED